jgi:protein-S-isoprenylcysteine O-methyltransferase Ste14
MNVMPAILEPPPDTVTKHTTPAASDMALESAPPLSDFFPASRRAILLNYLSALPLLLAGYAIYYFVPFYREMFFPPSYDALLHVLLAYVFVLPLYYATFPDSYDLKCRLFWRGIVKFRKGGRTPAERIAMRAVLVKAFFLPLMINCVIVQLYGVRENGRAFFQSGTFFPDGYWLVYRALFLMDVVFFTVGYAIEHPWLKNEIRSVEPTFFGWAVALACYPPFFLLTRQGLGWPSAEYPEFAMPWLSHLAAVGMLIGIAIYSWASVALCFKASNLTYRGTVGSGPYAWVRHPAYIAKNTVWWIGALPAIVAAAMQSPLSCVPIVLGMCGWSFIYVLRAYTEERHLRRFADYRVYCRKTPYRFIPGVI